MPTGDVEAASIEELHQKIQTLEKENNKEEEYRNYMQLERVRELPAMLTSCRSAVRRLSSTCYSGLDVRCSGNLLSMRRVIHDDCLRLVTTLCDRTRSMLSGRSPRKTLRIKRQKCAIRTGKWKKWRTCINES